MLVVTAGAVALGVKRSSGAPRSDHEGGEGGPVPALSTADRPPDSRSDIEDMGRLTETIKNRFPKRGEVVNVEKGGALRPRTHKVGRLEEDRDIPMDQESGSVTGKDIYGFTEAETRPEEAIRALSETRSVLAEGFEGVHRLTQA
jgi:hypothetical protein